MTVLQIYLCPNSRKAGSVYSSGITFAAVENQSQLWFIIAESISCVSVCVFGR